MSRSLQYPIGPYRKPNSFNPGLLDQWIQTIADFPLILRNETENLSQSQLDTPYRPGGWTVRQVVHHCADSHMNSFIRFKLALTEENPTIKPYEEALWAELPDGKEMPLETSLSLLDNLHKRWVVLLRSLKPAALKKTFYHPQNKLSVSLEENISLYAWHCSHHLAHITSLKQRNFESNETGK